MQRWSMGRGVRLAVILIAAAMLAAACGDSGSSSSSTTTAATGSSASTTSAAPADPVAAAQARLDTWVKGTNLPPPTSAPTPAAGKKVFVLSCFQLIESCSIPTAATVEAAKVLGWDAKVVDIGGDPSKVPGALRDAVAAKADAAVLVAIDCGPSKAALTEAKAAGLKIVTFYAFDCDDPAYNAGPPLFDASVIYGDGSFKTYADFQTALASAKADWLIVQTKGKAKVISFSQKDAVIVSYLASGLQSSLKANCPDCKIVDTIDIVAADIANGQLVQKFQNSLLQHPDANAAVYPIDAYGVFGLGTAIATSGRQLAVIGGEGYPAAMQQLRDGVGIQALGAISGEWAGYAAIDTLVRLFAGEKAKPSGIGWQIVTKDKAPATGGYQPSIDFKAAYKKAWGK